MVGGLSLQFQYIHVTINLNYYTIIRRTNSGFNTSMLLLIGAARIIIRKIFCGFNTSMLLLINGRGPRKAQI